MNYRELLIDQFPDVFSNANGFVDPNKTIDYIIDVETLDWYPPHLYLKEKFVYLICPFNFDEDMKEELIEDCAKAETVCTHLKDNDYRPKVLFITTNVNDSNILHSLELSESFGIIHLELDQPYLESSIDPNFTPTLRLIPFAFQYLSSARHLTGAIGEKVIEIAATVCDRRTDVTLNTLRKWIIELLGCDHRFVLDNGPIEFMSSMERLLSDRLNNIRDHYFHAFNTMLLGFVVIDQNYQQFANLCSNYGPDIVVEYVWLITSLYHDIGYPAMLYDQITKEIYSDVQDTEPITRSIIQLRQDIWDRQYQRTANFLNSFFIHVRTNSRQRWHVDPFKYPPREDKLLQALKTSFVEFGHHGAQGTLKLMQMIDSILKDIGDQEEREYIYRHIVISSISILFHDKEVRDTLRAITCSQIKSVLFPFSALLTYIDVLQDDRRDITSSYCRPDILKGFEVQDGAIVGVLDMSVLGGHRKSVIQAQLSDVISFFLMNGINLKMPMELV